MITKLLSFIRNDNGATAIEYGLIAALVAIVLVAGLTALGDQLNVLWGQVVTALGGV